MPADRGPAGSRRTPISTPRVPEPPRLDLHLELALPWQRLVARRTDRHGPDAADALTEVYALEGEIDESVLAHAVDLIVARHPVLQRRVGAEQSPALRRPAFEVTDISSGASGSWLQARQEIVLDPAVSPLFRVSLARGAGQRHLLAVTGHEMAFDGWSFGVVLDELTCALEHRPPRPLPAAPVSGLGTEGHQAEALERAAARLARTDPTLSGTDRPLVGSAVRRVVRVTDPVAGQIAANARALGSGDLGVLLALSRLALNQVLGTTDFAIGVPTMRRRPDEEHRIGPYTDLALVWGNVERPGSVTSLVRSQQQQLLELIDGSVPLIDVLERTGLDESAVRVTVTVEPDHQPFALPGLSLGYVAATSRRMRPDVAIVGSRDADGLELFVDSRIDAVGRSAHRELCAALVQHLAAFARQPGSRTDESAANGRSPAGRTSPKVDP